MSRKHFNISYADGKYFVQDLGSAGGTFLRIVPGHQQTVVAGTMFMLGKHQLMTFNPLETGCVAKGVPKENEEEGNATDEDDMDAR